MKIRWTLSLSLGLVLFINHGFAHERYYLCGPDEDGCSSESPGTCFCIPYNERAASQRYCLDFNTMRCTPLEESPACNPSMVFANQGSCLATMFQSIPTPPCKVTDFKFCQESHSLLCNQDGQLDSCH